MSVVEATLEAVNRIRAERGIGEPLTELPKGYSGSYRLCPIARALDCGVTPDVLDFGMISSSDFESLPTPDAIREFVNAFDSGDLPEFFEDRWPAAAA